MESIEKDDQAYRYTIIYVQCMYMYMHWEGGVFDRYLLWFGWITFLTYWAASSSLYTSALTAPRRFLTMFFRGNWELEISSATSSLGGVADLLFVFCSWKDKYRKWNFFKSLKNSYLKYNICYMATYTPVCTLHNKFIKHLTPIISRTIVTSKRQYLIECFNKHYFTEHPNKQKTISLWMFQYV